MYSTHSTKKLCHKGQKVMDANELKLEIAGIYGEQLKSIENRTLRQTFRARQTDRQSRSMRELKFC